MSALIVTESIFGNTLAIAAAIGDGLADALGPGQVRLVHASQAPLQLPSGVELVVVGAPTHTLSLPNAGTRALAAGGLSVEPASASGSEAGWSAATAEASAQPAGVEEWIALVQFPDEVKVATFDTSIPEKRPLGTAARAAAKALRQRGIQTTVGPSFDVTGMEGPLADGELGRATAWGRQLVTRQTA